MEEFQLQLVFSRWLSLSVMQILWPTTHLHRFGTLHLQSSCVSSWTTHHCWLLAPGACSVHPLLLWYTLYTLSLDIFSFLLHHRCRGKSKRFILFPWMTVGRAELGVAIVSSSLRAVEYLYWIRGWKSRDPSKLYFFHWTLCHYFTLKITAWILNALPCTLYALRHIPSTMSVKTDHISSEKIFSCFSSDILLLICLNFLRFTEFPDGQL